MNFNIDEKMKATCEGSQHSNKTYIKIHLKYICYNSISKFMIIPYDLDFND